MAAGLHHGVRPRAHRNGGSSPCWVARAARVCGLDLLPAFFYSLTGALFGVARLVNVVVRAYGTAELLRLL
jgi:hypothetical protein